jgi:hypothetical protein
MMREDTNKQNGTKTQGKESYIDARMENGFGTRRNSEENLGLKMNV